MFDAVVVGAGPNGLAAAVALASWGHSVCLLEGGARVGGGLLSHSDLESGFIHDHCAAVHPLGALSPFYSSLDLHEHGLRWCSSPISAAHPLLGRPAVLGGKDLSLLSESLGARDARRWASLFAGFARAGRPLVSQLLGPPSLLPRAPLSMLRFAFHGLRSASSRAQALFADAPAQAFFAGFAGHAILPIDRAPSAAAALLFALSAQLVDWPCARGGSEVLARALVSKFRALGGELRTHTWVRSHADLPPHRVALYDVSPRALVELASDELPVRYKQRLARFRYGPGTFKVDYTLDGPIPWTDPAVAQASTVHVGASLEEIATSERAAFEGSLSERPYLIVCQQSALDPTRAPAGKHTGYAYCHVPHGYQGDASEQIEAQLERFAPGFRDLIRTRRSTTPAEFERNNPNLVGGAIGGGVADLSQLFTRPVARLDAYSTPNPRLFLCSASTPPAGGVHGMCGYHAARSAARRLRRMSGRLSG